MNTNRTSYTVLLFQSYSHKDAEFRHTLEDTLSAIPPEGILRQWSDNKLFAGKAITSRIQEKLNQVDIAVFLLSRDFIASDACKAEWRHFKNMEAQGRSIYRIPIIIRECSWKDFLGNDDVKALPNDGQPVTSFENQDEAWQQIYEGVKNVVNHVRNTFTPISKNMSRINTTEFISDTHLSLADTFIFPRLTCVDPLAHGIEAPSPIISKQSELLALDNILVFGPENSGKTALARHLYLSLIDNARAVLLVEQEHLVGKHKETFERAYGSQYHGDYALWRQKDDKTLIVDTTTAPAHLHEIVAFAKETFSQIIVVMSYDDYHTYYKDHFSMLDFAHMKIEPLSPDQQEKLIRKRLHLMHEGGEVLDGKVDQVEKRVDSIVISHKILPRYPFYVLSILQTYESYMPSGVSITSYGHCYLVLIIARLVRSGIANEDDQLNTCFNFAEHLAYAIYVQNESGDGQPFQFSRFVNDYKRRFIISDATVNRLKRLPYGLIDEEGNFRAKYMYYYFLGKYLSGGGENGSKVVEAMCQDSHREVNYLTILFAIHHTRDTSIIDDILEKSKRTLDDVPVATFDREETSRFNRLIEQLPADIQSDKPVAEERELERKSRQEFGDGEGDLGQEGQGVERDKFALGVGTILKNNRILGQVLRTKYGNLERVKIREIIETISDGGLRLVNLLFRNEEELSDYAKVLNSDVAELEFTDIQKALSFISFLWSMSHVEMVVREINFPEIQESVETVVDRKKSVAYDLIRYFAQLDSEEQLTDGVRDLLVKLLGEHKNEFVQSVLSFRTQHYMNTHESRAPIEQSVCKHLDVDYQRRLRSRRVRAQR